MDDKNLNQTNNVNQENGSKLEIINDKSVLSPEEKFTSSSGKNFKIENKNIIYIIIIIGCLIGITVFLLIYNKNNMESQNSIKIIDRTEYCGEALKFFYTDENYKYYFACQKDYYVIKGIEEYTLEDALEKKIVDVSILDENNIKYYKENIR